MVGVLIIFVAYNPNNSGGYGHRLNDHMWPWDGNQSQTISGLQPFLPAFSPTDIRRPLDVIDHRALGVSYDTDGVLSFSTNSRAAFFNGNGDLAHFGAVHTNSTQTPAPGDLKFNSAAWLNPANDLFLAGTYHEFVSQATIDSLSGLKFKHHSPTRAVLTAGGDLHLRGCLVQR